MRELEQKYPDVLVAIGVHSGKFIAERITERIREAAIRLGNVHPIVNDRQFRVWRSYAVNAWPTTVFIDPTGRVLGRRPGEFTAAELAPLIDQLVEAYGSSGGLRREVLHPTPALPAIAPGRLRYPDKVALGPDGAIAIADTGHHRVLVGRLSADGMRATIEREVGRLDDARLADGPDGTLDMPQGMCFAGDLLYIADAGTHTVRAVDLRTGDLRTVAGTGRQLRTREDQRAGALSSPWDVALVGETLYIAMAGIHQIWVLDLATGMLRPQCGGFREDLVDGPNLDASLAQPMGLAPGGDRLWFADAESSAIRSTDLGPPGRVDTIVGTGLFDFGDVDGVGDQVRLQHCQGIARHPDGRLLIADSYNDALKWVDPVTREVRTWVRGLHEPGGVACGTRHAYVADTNAHRVAVVEYETGVMTDLVLS